MVGGPPLGEGLRVGEAEVRQVEAVDEQVYEACLVLGSMYSSMVLGRRRVWPLSGPLM
jgi:hypothetical protein